MQDESVEYSQPNFCVWFKVTVQSETEGNGQKEIVSHIDRSEVKLSISEKNIVISHIQNEILNRKVGLRGRKNF